MTGRVRNYRDLADPSDPDNYTEQVRFGVWDVPLSYPELRMGWRCLREGKLPGEDYVKAVVATMKREYPVEADQRSLKRAALAGILLTAISELERYGKRPDTKSIRPRRVKSTRRGDRTKRRTRVSPVPGERRPAGRHDAGDGGDSQERRGGGA